MEDVNRDYLISENNRLSAQYISDQDKIETLTKELKEAQSAVKTATVAALFLLVMMVIM